MAARHPVIDQIDKFLLDPIRREARLIVTRCLINLIDDSEDIQLAQLDGLDGETRDEIEHFQPFGLASNVPAGSEGVLLSVGAVRSHGILINCGHRQYRLTGLATGDVALYDAHGQSVMLTAAGIRISSAVALQMDAPEVDITANSMSIDVDQVNFSGSVSISNNLTVDGNSVLGEGATKAVKLSDDSPATQVLAK